VLRGAGPAGDDGDTVVTGELDELWVEFGIVPVGLEDGGLEVVEVEGPRNPVEGPEGVLQGSQEGFGVLMQDRLAVGLAGEAQDDAEDPGATLASIVAGDRCTEAEVDLSLLAGLDLDAPDAVGFGGLEGTDEAFDGLVGALEGVLGAQVLEDALGGEAGFNPAADPWRMGLAERKWPGRAGGRGGTLRIRAGGRVGGTVCRAGLVDEVAADGVAMDVQITGDLSDGPSLGVEREDCLLCLHREYIGHAGGNDSGFPGIHPPSGLSPGWYTLTRPEVVHFG